MMITNLLMQDLVSLRRCSKRVLRHLQPLLSTCCPEILVFWYRYSTCDYPSQHLNFFVLSTCALQYQIYVHDKRQHNTLTPLLLIHCLTSYLSRSMFELVGQLSRRVCSARKTQRTILPGRPPPCLLTRSPACWWALCSSECQRCAPTTILAANAAECVVLAVPAGAGFCSEWNKNVPNHL